MTELHQVITEKIVAYFKTFKHIVSTILQSGIPYITLSPSLSFCAHALLFFQVSSFALVENAHALVHE